jgi:hypothetical protein
MQTRAGDRHRIGQAKARLGEEDHDDGGRLHAYIVVGNNSVERDDDLEAFTHTAFPMLTVLTPDRLDFWGVPRPEGAVARGRTRSTCRSGSTPTEC